MTFILCHIDSTILYMDRILFTSNLKVLNLLYLSCISQMNVACFMAGPILGPVIVCGLMTTAVAMGWSATLIVQPLPWL